MLNVDYVVHLHRLYDSEVNPKLGGIDYILEKIVDAGKTVILVETPLIPGQSDSVNIFTISPGKKILARNIKIPISRSKIVWVYGVLANLYVCFKYPVKGAVVISTDPLASFVAVIGRVFGLYKFHYYHCTDYSTIRFDNKILNLAYRYLLKLSIRRADLVGCVSTRIENEVKKLPHRKLFYIPNSPDFDSYDSVRKQISDRSAFSIVLTCAFISPRYKVLEIIELLSKLKEKFPNIKLVLIGAKSSDSEYLEKVASKISKLNCGDNVFLVGQVSREENCELISKCLIGLAFYNKNDTYSWYSDPLKIREYAALGVVCVADDVTSAAQEMQQFGAGFMVANFDDALEKIKLLLTNPELYSKMVTEALDWSKTYDKKLLVTDLVKIISND